MKPMDGVFEMHKSLAIIVTVILLFSLFSIVLAAIWMGKITLAYNPNSQYPTSSVNPQILNPSTPNSNLATSIPTLSPNPATQPQTSEPTSAPASLASPDPSNPTSTFTPITQSTPAPNPNSFSDDFSSQSFNRWTLQNQTAGAGMSIINGVACFTTPIGANGTYSYVQENGFISTVNSTITASQDVYLSGFSGGFTTGNGAIFFLYVIDASGQNGGNIAVGIDGSDVWGLWIGGFPIYNYVFQTAGTLPQIGAWSHVVLTINNSALTVNLAVNGTTVINVIQHQFTDATHSVNLISGIGEDWNSVGKASDLEIDNVRLDISN